MKNNLNVYAITNKETKSTILVQTYNTFSELKKIISKEFKVREVK